jgi:hypothetical protein
MNRVLEYQIHIRLAGVHIIRAEPSDELLQDNTNKGPVVRNRQYATEEVDWQIHLT